jgi:hypothetical protein
VNQYAIKTMHTHQSTENSFVLLIF